MGFFDYDRSKYGFLCRLFSCAKLSFVDLSFSSFGSEEVVNVLSHSQAQGSLVSEGIFGFNSDVVSLNFLFSKFVEVFKRKLFCWQVWSL